MSTTARHGAALCVVFAALVISACGGGGGESGAVQPVLSAPEPAVRGQAQKGPYLAGSEVVLYRLDGAARRNGESVELSTGALGWFVPATPWSGLTEVQVEGRFFDETTAGDSAQPLRLTTLARMPAGATVRVNLFTHFAAARIRALMSAGADYDAARERAWSDLGARFDLLSTQADQLAQLDLTDGNGAQAADNANLLLFSAALLAAGAAQQGVDALAADFADNGLIDAAALPQWIRVSVYAAMVDLDQVRARLETLDNLLRAPGFAELGNGLPAWVAIGADSDNDGVTDADELLSYGSDPLSIDSDGDGMPDGWEISNQLDVLNDDAADDADADGLANAAERVWLTDPRSADSDGDGWQDGFETAAGGDPADAVSLPLVFLSSPPLDVETGFPWVYAAQVTRSDAQFSLDQGPAGLALDPDTGLISWTPALAQLGTFTVTLRADVSDYSTTQSFAISTVPGNSGDINEDATVDARDILLAQRIALGLMTPTGVQRVRADVSGDGTVQAVDVIRLQRLVLGL